MIEENKENETTNENENVVRKTISIKGVSADLYRKIQKLSNETGKTIGQVTDDAYRSFMALGIKRGRKIVYTGDTRPVAEMPEFARNAGDNIIDIVDKL